MLRRAFPLAILLLGLLGCGENGPAGPVGDSIPASLEALSEIVGAPGETVTTGVRVRATDGSFLEGIGVRFEPAPGQGSVEPELAVTDGEGVAVTGWTLGAPVGAQRLDARVAGYDDVRAEVAATVVAVPEVFTELAVGGAFTCGIGDEGRAFCWGAGEKGQLGTGGLLDRATPVPLGGDLRFTALSAGASHACGVNDEGAAFCWGEGADGRLGTGDPSDGTEPRAVAGGGVWTVVHAGGSHTCGLTPEGEAYCWGSGVGGRLGTGDETNENAPRAVEGGILFASLSVGARHGCGLTSEGEAYCWGEPGPWLGTEPGSDHRRPSPVSGERAFASISVGDAHTCAVAMDGDEAYCWGVGEGGRLGTGSDEESLASPARVAGELRFHRVSAAGDFTCGLALPDGEGTEEGAGAEAWCWGRGVTGQLGDGASGEDHEVRAPVPVSGSARFLRIDAAGGAGGTGHACAATPEGEVLCWGAGDRGQLGTGGSGEGYFEPEPVGLGSGNDG